MDSSTTTPKAETPPAAPKPAETPAPKGRRPPRNLHELKAALDGQPPVPAAPPAETPAAEKPPKPPGKPKDVAELAERLGLDVKDVYGIAVPSDQVEGLTFGKLKDLAAEHEAF